jgi:transposase InsO family protein
MNGSTYLIVAIDKLSRYPIASDVPDTTARTAQKFIVEEIIVRFGVPRIITADQGSSFTSHIFQEFTRKTGITLNLTPAY